MQDEIFMRRCLSLAELGKGSVSPNPMVGAILVYEGKIIGEGYHQQYGHEHAEVNCINSVSQTNKHLIPLSVIYVSLEPCAHFGKTPPCSDLIIKQGIRKVIIGCRDPFKQVNGKGIEKIRAAGIEVITGILEKDCIELNKRFFTFHTRQRPYIVLKWAQTADKKIAYETDARLLISNEFTNRLVHQWRSEEAGILVGTNTALSDDPSLNNRLWHGNSPVRLIIDMQLRLPATLHVFDGQQRTVVFNSIKGEDDGNTLFYKISAELNIIDQILDACYQLQIQSILVEGGASLLQSFINSEIWDEARIITNKELIINDGLNAPVLNDFELAKEENIFSDCIHYLRKAT